MKTFLAICLCVTLAIAAAVAGTNNPGIIGLPGSNTNTNPPGTLPNPNGSTIRQTNVVYVDGNGNVTSPTDFWGTNEPAIKSKLPNATATASGFQSTNDYTAAQTFPGWQRNMERVPWRGNLAGNVTDATNLIAWYKSMSNNFGYTYMMTWQQAYATNRSNGSTGSLLWNSNNFPMGMAAYKQLLHTNGYRWFQWYDGSAGQMYPATNTAMVLSDLQTLISWNPDFIWFDGDGWLADQIAMILKTNKVNIPIAFGVSADHPTVLTDIRAAKLGTSFRMHVAEGDPTTWPIFVSTADTVETNVWKYSGPDSHFFVGPEVNYGPDSAGGNGGEAAIVLTAMWGNDLCANFGQAVSGSPTWGHISISTNRWMLEVQSDPAAVCARRVINANGCWVYLKPLGSVFGPDYALYVLNTNNAGTTNITFTINDLNNGLQPLGLQLQHKSYTVHDLKNDIGLGHGVSSFTFTNIGFHDYVFCKLIANKHAPETKFYALNELTVASSVWTRITHEDYYGPYGPSNNWYIRDGYRCSGSANTFVYIPVPDWATSAQVSYWVACNANCAWTNFPGGTIPVAGSPTYSIAGNNPAVPIFATNGNQRVSYSVKLMNTVNNGNYPNYIVDNWSTGTNATAVRALISPVKITFE